MAARFDSSPEWASETFSAGEDEAFFFLLDDHLGTWTPAILADLSGEEEPVCAACADFFTEPAHGVGLFIDGQGFRSLETYATEDDYEAAVKTAEQASAEAGDDEPTADDLEPVPAAPTVRGLFDEPIGHPTIEGSDGPLCFGTVQPTADGLQKACPKCGACFDLDGTLIGHSSGFLED